MNALIEPPLPAVQQPERDMRISKDQKRADDRTRTGDLRFTKPLLYRLSYIGLESRQRTRAVSGKQESQVVYGAGPGET